MCCCWAQAKGGEAFSTLGSVLLAVDRSDEGEPGKGKAGTGSGTRALRGGVC